MMRLSALYFVLLTLLASSLSEPDIEQSLANFRKALGTKLLAVDPVPAPKPPAVLISAPVKPVHTNLGIIQNYLGTETNNETAEAIQGVNNLVSSGILPGFRPIEVDNILSPLSESNPNYSGTKKPCHHKEDVVANKDTELKPFSDSHNINTPLSETTKPCHHKETFTQKPLSQTETPLQPNKDLPSVTEKPCHHNSLQTITSAVALNSNSDKVEIIEQRPVISPIPEAPLLPPWQVPSAGQVIVGESTYIPDNQFHHNSLQTFTSAVALNSNNDKLEIIEQRPVISPIPEAPLLPPWQVPSAGQVIVGESTYIPDNQYHHNSLQTITSAVALNSNSDKLEIIEQRPVINPIPEAPLLPPWQVPIAGQVIVGESTYIPDNQFTLAQPGLSISSSSSHDCNKDNIEIVERPVPSLIPALPQLLPWQYSSNGHISVEQTNYNSDNNHVTYAQHVPIPTPEAPQLLPVLQVPVSGQVVVEQNAYALNKPCHFKTYDRTNVVFNQSPIKLPPVFNDPPVPVNVVPLPVPSVIKVPAKVTMPQPFKEAVAEPMPIPSEVNVPSSYTYQQVKGDGSIETTFSLQDGVHIRYVPNPYLDVNSYREYSQRPANNLIATNIKSYHDSVYPSVQSQYNQYPNIENGFNEYNIPSRPYDYNQYPVQQHITQRPYNPYLSGYNNAPRPQVNNYYQPGDHIHPQSFNHPQHQQPHNFDQPSYGGYSYKQIHGDGSITSYNGNDGNVQTLKSGPPQLLAYEEVAKKPAPKVPFANIVRQPQNFNVFPNEMVGDLTPVYNPMMAQEGVNPMYFSYMFKQLGNNGAARTSGSNNNVMSSPSALPVVNTNVKRPESGLPAAGNSLSNVHVTSYSAFTNGNKKSEPISESGVSAATDYSKNTDKSVTEIKQSGPGFKVAYGIGEKTNSKKHSIEYNPIIVLDTSTGRSNYYYSQTGSDGFKTEYIGDKDKVVVQNADVSPKVNERPKYRGDIPE